MKNISLLLFISLIEITSAQSQLPFKFDSLYKNIYAADLCRLMETDPGLVLIDVRTPGEFDDTSRHTSLNQGRLKGAINIEIDLINKDVTILNQYKDKTMVFYCSHSQRSRRVSKLLTENGFTGFYNLNGGMSVINHMKPEEFPCREKMIVTNVPYRNCSFDEAAGIISSEKKLLALDVRPQLQYESKDSIAENNIGRIKGAINIPYDEFGNRAGELKNYRDGVVLVYSSSGDGDGARAARELEQFGFQKVYHLLGGINSFVAFQENDSWIENPAPFILVNANRAFNLMEKNKDLIIYDTR